MFHWFRQRRRRRLLDNSDTSAEHWAKAWNGLPLLEGIDHPDSRRLRELATLFLHEKAFSPARGMRITLGMRQFVALQACLPLLGLDLDWYRGWFAVVVYPATFVSTFDTEDDAGVVHRIREPRSGESWDRGPLILSWGDALAGGEVRDGYNVVLHECAHKLDALDGAANGKPPLHRDMNPQQWADVFGAAYEDHCSQIDGGIDPLLDPYAAEEPAEFFAVLSEAFFEVPQDILATYPEVYDQLRRFYRQDPARRLSAIPVRTPIKAAKSSLQHALPSCNSRRSPPSPEARFRPAPNRRS